MTDLAQRMTSAEIGLAEDVLRVLDYISRIHLAVERGDWRYLWDKAADLARVAEGLHLRLSAYPLPEPGEPADFDPVQADAAVVRAAVAAWSQHYTAGRALYPSRDSRTAAATR